MFTDTNYEQIFLTDLLPEPVSNDNYLDHFWWPDPKTHYCDATFLNGLDIGALLKQANKRAI